MPFNVGDKVTLVYRYHGGTSDSIRGFGTITAATPAGRKVTVNIGGTEYVCNQYGRVSASMVIVPYDDVHTTQLRQQRALTRLHQGSDNLARQLRDYHPDDVTEADMQLIAELEAFMTRRAAK